MTKTTTAKTATDQNGYKSYQNRSNIAKREMNLGKCDIGISRVTLVNCFGMGWNSHSPFPWLRLGAQFALFSKQKQTALTAV